MAQLELDRVLQGLTNDFNKFRSSFGQTMTSVQKTFVSAEATVKSIVSTAGGSVWSTFTGSIQLAAVQLARFFLPTIAYASEKLQEMASWLAGLTPEGRAVLNQFAEMAGAAAIAGGVIRLLGLKAGGTVVAFGALILATEKFAQWLDKRITEQQKAFETAAGKQFTHADIAGTPEYQQAKAMVAAGQKEDAGKYLQELINKQNEQLQYLTKNGDPRNSIPEIMSALGRLMATRQELIFGEKLPDTIKPYVPPELPGSAGLSGLMDIINKQLGTDIGTDIKKLFGSLSTGGRGRRPFAFDFATEMQPRFSSIEEARKQFQLQALKSPLEQQLMQDLRDLSREGIAYFQRERAKDVPGPR